MRITWLGAKSLQWIIAEVSGGAAIIRLFLSICHCDPSSPTLLLCAARDAEASPPSSDWKCSFLFRLCLTMRLRLCLFLWSMKTLCRGCNAGCAGDAETLRCRAFAAASGVPVVKWSGVGGWLGLQRQSAAGGSEMKCSRAHSSDKMAGRKSEGCKQNTKRITNGKQGDKHRSALCYANMQVHHPPQKKHMASFK